MSDRALRHLTDFTTLMAKGKYAKVLSGDPIGSLLGAPELVCVEGLRHASSALCEADFNGYGRIEGIEIFALAISEFDYRHDPMNWNAPQSRYLGNRRRVTAWAS